MGWLIFIIVIVVVWLAAKSIKPKQSKEIPLKITVQTSTRSGRFDPEYVVDTGQISEITGGTYCINPKSPFPLTIKGVSLADATQIKKLLDGEACWERNLSNLTFLIAQNNIEFVELEEFVSQLRTQANKFIETKRLESDEWAEASEKDRYDLLIEYENEAIESLSSKPSNEHALYTLLFGHPGDVTADDRLLNMFAGNNDIYRFYLYNLGRGPKAVQVPADEYYRKSWESLVELGFAKRGKDIDIQSLLEGLRVKDINEYFNDRLEKKLTRKTAAIEFAAAQPDVIEILSKHISFRELFQISQPDYFDISEIKKCYEYATAQAEIIRDTYVAGYRTLRTLLNAQDAEYDGWEIEAEDCCQKCSKLNGKKTKRIPSNLPPFHVGCTCSLEGVYD